MARTVRRNGRRDRGCSCWLCRYPKAWTAWFKACRATGAKLARPKGAK